MLPMPPKTKFAAGLSAMVGVLALFGAAGNALQGRSAELKRKFPADLRYEEEKEPYQFRYFVTWTGPAAERALGRGIAALAGVGFLVFGLRLLGGTAGTILPGAGVALLAGIGVGMVSASAARNGRAAIGLPGMGLAMALIIAAFLLGASRSEYLSWRRSRHPATVAPGGAARFAGGLLLVYGLLVTGFAVFRTATWLEPVRGQTSLGLRAEVTASTGMAFLGNVMKSAAEKSRSFEPGPGFFLHPQAFAVGWGALWAAAGLAVLRGRGPTPQFVGLATLSCGAGMTAVAVLCLFAALPWYAALPVGVFPGCAVLAPAGVLLLLARRRLSGRPA